MRIKLTKSQWERFSEIVGNMGLLYFGATFIPAIFDIHKVEINMFIYGLILSISSIILSILLARNY
jgi:hypothetical protein